MDDGAMEKYGAVGIVWFAVFALVGSVLSGDGVVRTDSASEIASFYADNDTEIQLGAFLISVGAIGLVWFFGTLWRAMFRAEEGSPRLAVIALSGFLISAAMSIAGFGVHAATAAGIDHLSQETAAFSFGLTNVFLAFAATGDVTMALAIAALAWRTGFLPRWVTGGGLIVAIVSLLATYGIASDHSFFGMVDLIAFLTWLAWLLAIGVTLFRSTATGPAESELPNATSAQSS